MACKMKFDFILHAHFSIVSVFILFRFLRRFRQNYLYLLPEPTIHIYNKV